MLQLFRSICIPQSFGFGCLIVASTIACWHRSVITLGLLDSIASLVIWGAFSVVSTISSVVSSFLIAASFCMRCSQSSSVAVCVFSVVCWSFFLLLGVRPLPRLWLFL